MSRSPIFNTDCMVCHAPIKQEVGVQSFILESRGAEIEEKCDSCHSALVVKPSPFLEFEVVLCEKCALKVVEFVDSLIKEPTK